MLSGSRNMSISKNFDVSINKKSNLSRHFPILKVCSLYCCLMLFFGVILLLLAMIATPGCAQVEAVENLNLSKMEGVWYEMFQSRDNDSRSLDRCDTRVYTKQDFGMKVTEYNYVKGSSVPEVEYASLT